MQRIRVINFVTIHKKAVSEYGSTDLRHIRSNPSLTNPALFCQIPIRQSLANEFLTPQSE
jgi:hypothetical protein